MKDFREIITFLLAVVTIVIVGPDFLNNLDNLTDRNIFGFIIPAEAIAWFFCIIVGTLLLVITVWFVKFWIKYLQIRKEAKQIAIIGANNTIALTAIMMENCQTLISSGKLDKIINSKQEIIRDAVHHAESTIHESAFDVINEDFFDKAVKALKSENAKVNFEPLIGKAYREIGNLNEVDKIIKTQYSKTFDQIKDEVTKWLRDKDIIAYLEITKGLHDKINELKQRRGGKIFFILHPRLEDIIKFDYRALIITTAAMIPIFKIGKDVLSNYSGTTVNALTGFMTVYDIPDLDYSDVLGGDIGNIPTGGFADDIGEEIVGSLLDLAGVAIPYIGFAFIIIRAASIVNKIIFYFQKPQKIREMREKVVDQISAFLFSLMSKSCSEIEHSSLMLVGMLKKEFADLQAKAKRVAKIKFV